MQNGGFGLADITGNVAVAVGLARLALEAFQLGFQLPDDVVEAFQIGFRGPQPQFRLMATRMQAGDARRLFQQGPPRLGLC